MAARLLGLTKVPVFKEFGDAKVTTEFGKDIPDYPTKGKSGDHWGLDIVRCSDGKTSELATVTAIADGAIYAQRKWVKGFNADVPAGNCVYIRHEDGTITKYLHLKYGTVPDWVKDNVPVKKGQVIGYIGNTGYSFGAHLHFQVEDTNGKPIDPEPYLTGETVIGGKYKLALETEYTSESEAQIMQEILESAGIKTQIIH